MSRLYKSLFVSLFFQIGIIYSSASYRFKSTFGKYRLLPKIIVYIPQPP